MIRLRKDIANLSPDHASDDARLVQFARPVAADRATVAQDCDAGAHAKHLVELMRDVNHADAAWFKLIEYAEQHFDFGFRKRGGRLVQHEYARFVRKRFRNFDK